MSTTFPGAIDNSISLPPVQNGITPVSAPVFNNLLNATLAIEGSLGASPGGIYGSVVARFDALETGIGNLQGVRLGQDLGGTLVSPLVIGIQGWPVASVGPQFGQVLIWNGISWIPSFISGDIDESDSIPGTLAVIAINGASVPVSGSLTAGNVLQVSGSSTLSYAPINLAGGTNFVSGILPSANLPTTTISSLGIIQLGGDLAGTATSQKVSSLTGVSGSLYIATTASTINWDASTSSPSLTQLATSTGNGKALTISAQSSSAGSSTGGNLILSSGAGLTAEGAIHLQVGGTNVLNITSAQNVGFNGSITVQNIITTTNYIVDSGSVPDIVVFCFNTAPITITLPVTTNGRYLIIKDTTGQSSSNPITIMTNGGTGLIDRSASPFVLATNFGSVHLVAGGSNGAWWIVANISSEPT